MKTKSLPQTIIALLAVGNVNAATILTLIGLLGLTLSSHGAVIFNESFEHPVTTNPDPLDTPTGWTWTTGAATNNRGVYDYANATDGSQIFFLFLRGGSSYAIQTTDTVLNESITVGSTYTLTLDYQGYRSDRILRFGVRLLAINDTTSTVTELATDTVNLASGHGFAGTNWNTTPYSLVVTPTTNAGERLAIEINNGGATTVGGAYIDNLTLSVEAIPEPSAALLGGLGLLALLRRRR